MTPTTFDKDISE
jgi:hypothetical protein